MLGPSTWNATLCEAALRQAASALTSCDYGQRVIPRRWNPLGDALADEFEEHFPGPRHPRRTDQAWFREGFVVIYLLSTCGRRCRQSSVQSFRWSWQLVSVADGDI